MQMDQLDPEQTLEAAIACHEGGDLEQADQLYRATLAADPDHLDALNLHAALLQDRGQAAESLAPLFHALELDPEFPEALTNLARAHRLLGNAEKAQAAAREATLLDPELGEAWLHLGQAALSLDKSADALEALRRAAGFFPDSLDVQASLGLAAQQVADYATAAEAWRALLRLMPDRIEALVNLGAALCKLDETDEALVVHRRAVALAPDDVTARGALAVTLYQRYEAAELVTLCQGILAIEAERPDILMMLGYGLLWLGRFDEALAAYRQVQALNPDDVLAARQIAVLDRTQSADENIARLQRQFADTSENAPSRIATGFALGAALDRTGEHEAAFRAFMAANAMDHARFNAAGRGFDLKAMRDYVDWACGTFTGAFFDEFGPSGNPSFLPVFIVGMPRSGTSLVEQIAASHPLVHGAGELRDIPILLSEGRRDPVSVTHAAWDREKLRCDADAQLEKLMALGGGAARVIDKLPDNVQFLGQIALMFPNARFILCRRDPRDVCVSCFTTHFGDNINWATDLVECAQRAVEVERLMRHWATSLPGRVREVTYETLVGDLETESRALIDFLGLEWDPACLEFHKTDRAVITASFQQVRQPLYDSSIGRWRRYEAFLEPMLAILEGRTEQEEPGAVLNQSALARIAAGDHAGAIEILRDCVKQFPAFHDARWNLGLALVQTKNFWAAIETWEACLAIKPDHARTWFYLGHAHHALRQYRKAAHAFERAVDLAPDTLAHHESLMEARWLLSDTKGARAACLRGLTLKPDDPRMLHALGRFESALGDFDASAACYRRVLAQTPDSGETLAALIIESGKGTPADLAHLRAIMDDETKPLQDRGWAGFGLGHALDKARDYDDAFAAFRTANALSRAHAIQTGEAYNHAELVGTFDTMIRDYTARVFPATYGLGNPSDVPVFVVGLPRSGSSLVEQILASHRQVFGAGECHDITEAVVALGAGAGLVSPEAWDRTQGRRLANGIVENLREAGGGALRVIDKFPGNLQWLGHIAALLPNARIIVCRRDWRDIALSCHFTHFAYGQEWSHDLSDMAAYFQENARLLDHWRAVIPNRMIEVDYETLIGGLEGESRRLVEFLGLDWDPACLEFHLASRSVNTASYVQVRQSLYSSSVGRWKPYRHHLGPLLEGLRGLIPIG